MAKPKRALGRGLDALIVEAEHSASEALSGGSKTGKTGVAGETGEIKSLQPSVILVHINL